MSDKVIDFPERRGRIPVNLPDIGCLRAVECLQCGHTKWLLMALPGEPIEEVACATCNFRLRLNTPTFGEPVE